MGHGYLPGKLSSEAQEVSKAVSIMQPEAGDIGSRSAAEAFACKHIMDCETCVRLDLEIAKQPV